MATTRAPSSSPSRVRVRVATLDDLDAVVALRLQLVHEERRSPLFTRVRDDADAVARAITRVQLAAESEVSFLAMDEEVAIGLLRCTVSRSSRLVHPTRYGFLTSAFVRPSHRRRGVLRALLAEAERWCCAHGLSEVRLHCTVENAEGNASWESLGYDAVEVVRRRVLSTER